MFVSRFRHFLPRSLPHLHKQEHIRPRARLTYILNHFRDESTQKVTQAPVRLLLRGISGPKPKSQFNMMSSENFVTFIARTESLLSSNNVADAILEDNFLTISTPDGSSTSFPPPRPNQPDILNHMILIVTPQN